MYKAAEISAMVEQVISPICSDIGIEIVDVEFKKEGGNHFLRIFIDKDGGINLGDCQQVSECLGALLDDRDPIELPYYLEVSSPGLDRQLKRDKDFIRFSGRIVDVRLHAAFAGKKKFRGVLVGKESDFLKLALEGEEISMPFELVSVCRLAVIL